MSTYDIDPKFRSDEDEERFRREAQDAKADEQAGSNPTQEKTE